MRTTFLKKGMREIWAHKVQYIFLVIVLGLGMATYGSLNDMSASRMTTFDRNYSECRFQDLRLEFLYDVTANTSTVERLLSDPSVSEGISAYEVRLVYNVFMEHPDGDGKKLSKGLVMGYQLFDEDGLPRDISVNRPLFFERDVPPFSSADPDECYIEHNFAMAYDMEGGEEIGIMNANRTYTFSVLSDVAIPEYYMVLKEGSLTPQTRSLGVLMVPMASAQRIYGSPDDLVLVNNIALRLKDPSSLGPFKENITALFEGNGIPVKAIEKEEDLARYFIKDDIEGDTKIFGTFPVVIFTVSGFGLFMALRRMVQTHRVQIGIFKSLGVPDRYILTYFGSIGIMVAMLGTALGLLISVPLNIWFQSIIKTYFGFPISAYSTNWRYYIGGAFISIMICLSCTLLPAWRALKVRPVDAIQQREGLSKRKVGRLASRVGRHGRLPIPLKLTLRNVLRKPGRTVTSVLGVGLAFSLFLSFMIITQTFVVMVNGWEELNLWDYEVGMEGFNPVNGTDAWRADNPEIEEVNPAILLPTQLFQGEDSADALVYAIEDIEGAFKMDLDEGAIRPGQLVISFYHRDELGVDVGDTVEIHIPVLTPETGLVMTKRPIVVSGIQTNHMGYFSFMDIGTLQNMTGLYGLANMIFLRTEDGARSLSLENSLIKDPYVSSVQHRSQIGNLIEEYFDLFMGIVYAISIISIAMSAAINYNLFMISAEEKRRDYATMKTLGTSTRRISKLIFMEAAIITVPGIALGSIGGWGLAYYMMTVGATFEAIYIVLTWSWLGFFIGAIMMAATVSIVSLVTLRYISKIAIANVIRERAGG